jgi:hypothetical protein
MSVKTTLMVLVATFCAELTPVSINAEDTRPVSEGNRQTEIRILNYLEPVVKSSGVTVRIYYQAACQPSRTIEVLPLPFPAIGVQPPRRSGSPLERVRQIFAKNADVAVVESPRGIIRVTIGKVSGAILRTKISSIRFDRYQRYTRHLAISALKETNEFQQALDPLGLQTVSDFDSSVQGPHPGLPHLPESMKDMTTDQILDVIAKTFSGVGFYGECSKPVGSDGRKLIWIE